MIKLTFTRCLFSLIVVFCSELYASKISSGHDVSYYTPQEMKGPQLFKNQLLNKIIDTSLDQIEANKAFDKKYGQISRDEIKIIDLRHAGLKVFPEQLWQCTNLEILCLGFNNLTTIPTNIASLAPSLNQLYLTANPIDEIPETLYKLKNLMCLDLSWTNVKQFSNEIKFLTSLIDLRIAYTPMDNLPVSLINSLSLKDFYLPVRLKEIVFKSKIEKTSYYFYPDVPKISEFDFTQVTSYN